MATKTNLLELLRLPSEPILYDTDQGSVYSYYPLPDEVSPDPTTEYAPHRDGLTRYEGNLADLPGLSTDCNVTPVTPDPVTPVWNNSLSLPSYVGDQVYSQQIPFSALTPASGEAITDIVVVYLPEYIQLLPGGDDYKILSGTIPAGSGTAAFTLRGVQSDSLTADRTFALSGIASSAPAPFWDPAFRPAAFAAGSFYSQKLPLTALFAAEEQEIVGIGGVSLPNYFVLFNNPFDNNKYLNGNIPEGTESITITLYGEQTDGQRTNKTFTLLPRGPAPFWNGSFGYKGNFYRGAFYEQKIPFSAITPGPTESIVSITGLDLPDYLTIQPGGDDYVYLRGIMPVDADAFYLSLLAYQSDGQSGGTTWLLEPIPEPPIWNGTFTLPNYTPGEYYEVQIPFSALTPGAGEYITGITGLDFAGYLTIEPGGEDYVYLRGTMPVGPDSVSINLTGYQSDNLDTGSIPFVIYPGTVTDLPPTWNGSFVFPDFTPDQLYSVQIPFSALTAAAGQTIADITVVYLPEFLTLEPGGSDYRILTGTIPEGAGRAVFTLRGTQSDGQTADKGFTVNPAPPINPPVWNSSLALANYTGDQLYNQALPLSALTAASGQSITNITGVDLPSYLTIQTISGVRYLRGTIPAGAGSLSITLRGVQSDGQTVDKTFAVYELIAPQVQPPVWNNTLVFAKFTPGQSYEQQLPLSALTAASGKSITDITGVSLPSFLTIQVTDGVRYLRGTVPSGTTAVSITLQGVQSDGLTANKSFIVNPAPAPPAWNNSFTLANYTPGEFYDQALPFSALTPSNGLSITNITGLYLPGYLSIQSEDGVRYLRGTIPVGSGNLTFVLRGIQSDGLTADKQFTINPVVASVPPVWNGSFTPLGFMAGVYYEQRIPYSALTPASGKTITDITSVTLPPYLRLLNGGGPIRFLSGTIPAGTTSIPIELQGVQSDGSTANQAFTLIPAPKPPVWNGSLGLAKFTPGQSYEHALPFTALTPASGKSITDITGVSLPDFLTVQTSGSVKFLRGTIPADTGAMVITLRGTQSDSLTADQLFTLSPVDAPPTVPPVWNNSWAPTAFTAGQYYSQQIPFTALTPAPGQTIVYIASTSVPGFMQVQNGPTFSALVGTIPAGTTSLTVGLRGTQSDGLTADKLFTISAAPPTVAPVWNGSLVLPSYTPGDYYNQALPFSALTPAAGQAITNIIGGSLPNYLTVQVEGNARFIRGTIPAGSGSVSFTLKGVQSDNLTANQVFTIAPVVVSPPVWNNSLTLPGYTPGAYYEIQLPFTALDAASGKAITDITGTNLPSYLSIQAGGSGYKVLSGTIPAGAGNLSFVLRGAQTGGLTADKVFAIAPVYVPAPPAWNNSLVLPGFVGGTYYEQKLPFTALTPNGGQTITNIVLVSYAPDITIQTDGNTGYRWLRGTIPGTAPYLEFTLQGVQSDGLTSNKTFIIYPTATQPPVWNNSLSLSSYTPGQFYEAQLPLSALTPASGKSITDIIPVALQSFLAIEPGNSGYKWLRGTIPVGYGSLSFSLRGVQSDSLTADKSFTIAPLVTAPPVWNGSFTPPGYTPGTLYDQNVPLSALTPANGKNITSIAGVNLPGYLSIRIQGNFYYLTGTIPAGSGNVPITLRGIQSDGQTANQTFTLASLTTQPPVWNNSLVPAGFTAGQTYEQALPLTALTAYSGQTITDITGASLPSFLSIQTTSGVRYLRGTIPTGTPSVSFTLRGVQSDTLTADRTFTIYAVAANPPVWNNSWTPPSFTPGSNYFQNIPFTALTAASGKSITGIVATSLPSYLTIQVDGNGFRYLQGTVPAGTASINFTLQGVQSDGLTADKVFAVAAVVRSAAPVWNNTFSPLGFTPGAYYEQYLPFSALDPASGKTITNILPYGLPSYLSIRTDGNGLRYLNGTIPAGTTSTSFTLQGVQSDGLIANKTFTINALVTTPPVWNNNLVLANYTGGQAYEQVLPFTSLTPTSGKTITDITSSNLPAGLSIQTTGGVKYLRGTIPTGLASVNFTLRGTQSDGLTADKTFTIYPVAVQPPVWNSSFTPPNFTAGQSYFQNVPVSALTPASGKTITSIVAVSLPNYLTIQVQNNFYYLTGTIPAGVASVSFALQGKQSDGLTADKTFTISAVQASAAPVWNGSLVPANYTPGAFYELQLAFTALTPASGKTITDIQAVALPSFFAVQNSGGVKYLRGTIPAGSGNVIFTLKGVQSDGQTANYSFQINPIAAQAPVWNGSFTPAGFTAGAYYDQQIPFSALTAAPGKSIVNIVGVNLPGYLSIQVSGGITYLRGTVPGGTSSISFTLQGIQSDGQTANQPFVISAGSTPSAPPVWNGTLSFPAFTPGTYYEQVIPFSALTPYTGRTITDITAVSIPSFLSIQPGGAGFKYLRGTVPTSGGYTQVSIALRGVQSDSLSANNTFTIYAAAVANRAPVFVSPISSPLVASYNTAFSFTWPATQASDPDGDALSWSLEYSSDGGSTYGALPGWASFNPATRTFTGTSATAGNAYFRRKVSDPGGLFAYNTFTLNTAAQANRAPVLVSPIASPLAASYNAPLSIIWASSDFSDPDGDVLTWSVQFSSNGGSTYGTLPSWATFNASNRTLSLTSTTTGLSYFRRTVTDPGGLSKSETFTLNTAAQTAPIVSAVDWSWQRNVAGVDASNRVYAWIKVDNSAGLTVAFYQQELGLPKSNYLTPDNLTSDAKGYNYRFDINPVAGFPFTFYFKPANGAEVVLTINIPSGATTPRVQVYP